MATDNEVDQTISPFDRILKSVGYKDDGSSNMDFQPKEVAEKLGRLFFNYMVESIYDSDWEGFSDLQKEGIDALLTDMALYSEHS